MIERCDTCYFYVQTDNQPNPECRRYPRIPQFMGFTPVATSVIASKQRAQMQPQVGIFGFHPEPDYGCGEWKEKTEQFL